MHPINILSLHLFLLLMVAMASSSKKLIFILSGQSNMSGRGGVFNGTWDHIVPPESGPCPSILRLDAALNWVEAAEPLHADIDITKTCGVGPGMPFANAVQSAVPDNAVMGLVPCAIGGTNITEWARGTKLYEDMVVRTKAAVYDGGVGKKRNKIGALLWYQGESDTATSEDAEAYKGRMEKLVWDLRSDLEEPQLLVIQVALASGLVENYTEIVRKAQLEIKLPNVLCVDAKGLPLQAGNLHLTTEAQVQLGKMLANAYLNLV